MLSCRDKLDECLAWPEKLSPPTSTIKLINFWIGLTSCQMKLIHTASHLSTFWIRGEYEILGTVARILFHSLRVLHGIAVQLRIVPGKKDFDVLTPSCTHWKHPYICFFFPMWIITSFDMMSDQSKNYCQTFNPVLMISLTKMSDPHQVLI